mmetsp:Transcript_21009/g.65986  ORF Transcript_21009/g.65986 Transcript_21009/m.65986 type:complete len:473 (+) Transcript_21009:172-1590(+)
MKQFLSIDEEAAATLGQLRAAVLEQQKSAARSQSDAGTTRVAPPGPAPPPQQQQQQQQWVVPAVAMGARADREEAEEGAARRRVEARECVVLSLCAAYVHWPRDVEALASTSLSVLRACAEREESRRHMLPRLQAAALVRLVASGPTSHGYKLTLQRVLDELQSLRKRWASTRSRATCLRDVLMENLSVVPRLFERFADAPVLWRLAPTALLAHFQKCELEASTAPRGKCQLAVFYEEGRAGLARDVRAAGRLISCAAAEGHGYAQYGLGVLYERGDAFGIRRDESRALRLFQQAAEAGVPEARWKLGVFHEDGRGGLAPSDATAVGFYRLAADDGLASAQFSLGAFYDAGRGGLPRRPTEALRLYRLAADKAQPAALCTLGLAYEHGRLGLLKDEKKALRLYTRAADRGFAAAAACIAFFHVHGKAGLPVDHARAAAWFQTASDNMPTVQVDHAKHPDAPRRDAPATLTVV